MLDFNLETLILVYGIFVLFRNNSNGFWEFSHGAQKMLDFNLETLILVYGTFVLFRNNSNGFWEFYHGAKGGLVYPRLKSEPTPTSAP